MKRLLLALVFSCCAFAQYFPPTITGGGSVGVTGGALVVALGGATTFTIPRTGTGLLASSAYTASVNGCIPFQLTSAYAGMSCDSALTHTNGTGNVIMSDSVAPIITVTNSGANQGAFFEYKNASGRQWLHGPGLANSAQTGWAIAEYTNGSFIGDIIYLKKGGTTCIGIANTECTSATLTVKNATASTGATSVLIQLGAADSATTATLTNAGTTKSAGYQSSDGTAGITGTTCIAAAMQTKNGLIVAGCT